MSKTEDEMLNESADKIIFLTSVGLDATGSVAMQLAGVRLLIRKLRAHEVEIERWARSGDFILSVDGENVSAVVNPDGSVMVVHTNELP